MLHGDNRDLKPRNLDKKAKYHKHIEQTFHAFVREFEYVKTLRVLDVGSRDGYAVEVFNKHGYDATGIEIVPEYAEYARSKQRKVVVHNIIDGKLYGDDPHAVFHQAIFSRHCVEHVKDTAAFLRGCSANLTERGHIFLTFPLETDKEWKARKSNDHLTHFPDKEAFRKFVRESDFEEIWFGKSKHKGIDGVGKEVLFIGRKK